MREIGYTTQDDANSRIAQLYTTGVPVPFELKYACKVQNAEEVEKALHAAFSPNRINPKREFFSIEPEQAIAILKVTIQHFLSKITKKYLTGFCSFFAFLPAITQHKRKLPTTRPDLPLRRRLPSMS